MSMPENPAFTTHVGFIRELGAKIERLQSINADLLAALQTATALLETFAPYEKGELAVVDQARAAIKRATEE